MKPRRWQKRVEQHFGFLTDHGFRLEPAFGDQWSTSARLVAEKNAVDVVFNLEFGRCEVQLIRLVDGAVPEYPIWITDDTPINYVLLDDVLTARDPTRLSESRGLYGLGEKTIDPQLHFWAEALQSVAADFLQGSVKLFDEVEPIIRARVHDNPPALQVWLPDDATVEEEQAEIRDARSTVPPGVNVTVRRYRRGRRPDHTER